jgi:spermidine synthase
LTKVGEHITLDIIGTTKEYDPAVFEKVINEMKKVLSKAKNYKRG